MSLFGKSPGLGSLVSTVSLEFRTLVIMDRAGHARLVRLLGDGGGTACCF